MTDVELEQGRSDERFMRRAIDLGRLAAFTSPNPRVGAVLVKDGRIVAEGRHEGAGSAHAEIQALAGADARGGVLYVLLEPCVHQGRTPPCAPAVAASGVRRVVAAMQDPDERVRGRGFEYLRARGIEVTSGVLESAARRLNAPYICHRTTGRSWVTLKLALTLDGRLGASDGSSRWITGPGLRKRVHAHRRQADAVVVGAGTVLADDPLLTVRDVPSSRQPARVVLDSSGRVPTGAKVFGEAPGAEDPQPAVIIATTSRVGREVRSDWARRGAEVLVLSESPQGVDLEELIGVLGKRNFVELYCEGGAGVATSLLGAGLVDRLELHYGPVLAGKGGPELGDLGVRTLADASRWSWSEVSAVDDGALVVLDRTGVFKQPSDLEAALSPASPAKGV